jgi:hypothetical protein
MTQKNTRPVHLTARQQDILAALLDRVHDLVHDHARHRLPEREEELAAYSDGLFWGLYEWADLCRPSPAEIGALYEIMHRKGENE